MCFTRGNEGYVKYVAINVSYDIDVPAKEAVRHDPSVYLWNGCKVEGNLAGSGIGASVREGVLTFQGYNDGYSLKKFLLMNRNS